MTRSLPKVMLLVLACAASSAGLIAPPLWPLAVVGLAVFFYVLRRRTTRILTAAISGLVFGAATAAATTFWFWHTLPLDFLGVESRWAQFVAVGLVWFYVVFALAWPVALGAVAIWMARNSIFFALLAAAVWVFVEKARMLSFALATWAPESLFGPHFSVASIGYCFAESPWLLRLAFPLGLDALNFVAALAAAFGAIISGTRESAAKWTSAVCAALLIKASAWWPPEREAIGEDVSLRVAVLATDLDGAYELGDHWQVKKELAAAAAARPPVDLILLPEEISLASIFADSTERREFLDLHFKQREVLVMATRESAPGRREAKVLGYDNLLRGDSGSYTKMLLMPLGEYAPRAASVVFSLLPDERVHAHLNELRNTFSRGERPAAVDFRGVRIGGLLCSDLLSPEIYHDLVSDNGATLLVNLANQFWFHGSRPLHWKTRQMAMVHAARTGRPLLVANNMAPSFVTAPSGRILSESDWGSTGLIIAALGPDGRSVLHSSWTAGYQSIEEQSREAQARAVAEGLSDDEALSISAQLCEAYGRRILMDDLLLETTRLAALHPERAPAIAAAASAYGLVPGESAASVARAAAAATPARGPAIGRAVVFHQPGQKEEIWSALQGFGD